MKQEQIDKFRKLLQKWISAYKWAEISYVILNMQEGPVLLSCRILFDASKTKSPFSFESEHILAGRDIMEVSDKEINTIIENALLGKLNVSDFSITLKPESSGHYSFFFNPYEYPPVKSTIRFPSLQIWGERRNQILSKIGNTVALDWEVQTADTPFYDFDELLTTIGLPPLIQMGDMSKIEIVLRWPARMMDSSAIERGNARILCQAAKGTDVNKIKLGYKIFHQDSIERGYLPGQKIKWKEIIQFRNGRTAVKVENAPVIQVFLSYKGEAIQSLWVTDPQKHLNLRHAIHGAFDDESKLLKQFLLDPKKDSDQFEIGVSILLNLLGFSTSHYGLIPKLQDGPDIVAITPRGKIAIIECTTGLLDEKGKLGKLIQRTALVQEKLKVSGYSMLVQPVIVTALPKDMVSAHVEEANKHKILIVCHEEIEILLNQIALPPDADALFNRALQTIGESDQKSLF